MTETYNYSERGGCADWFVKIASLGVLGVAYEVKSSAPLDRPLEVTVFETGKAHTSTMGNRLVLHLWGLAGPKNGGGNEVVR